jgi:hypothetical protein
MLTVICRGLKLAAARLVFMIGYAVLAVAAFVVTTLTLVCVLCCVRRKKERKAAMEEDSTYQLHQLYHR